MKRSPEMTALVRAFEAARRDVVDAAKEWTRCIDDSPTAPNTLRQAVERLEQIESALAREPQRRRRTGRTTAAVVAMALSAMAAPVLAQEYDMSRGLPEFDMSRAGPSAGVYSAMITPPGAVAPLFYSGSTPAGPFATITTHSGKTTVTITTGPGGRMTTCFTSWDADGRPIVNCL